MYSLNQVNKSVSCGRDPARSLPLWRGFLLIPLILVCFAFAPQTRALVPPPDGCYPGFTTAEGCQALQFVTTGVGNTGLGWRALFSAAGSSFNTGVGAGALVLNHAPDGANTAVGAASLLLNVFGSRNTAVGAAAMVNNAGDTGGNGSFNGAVGAFALNGNTTGFSNNAMGDSALFRNEVGAANTAVGDLALEDNDATGAGKANFNCAFGAQALQGNVTGDSNNAVGASALVGNDDGLFNQAFGAFALSSNSSGASNVAIGDSAAAHVTSGSFNTVVGDTAGQDITDGTDNIYIGAGAGTEVGNESQTIRIGQPGFIGACFIQGISGVGVSGDPVVVDGNGQLGTAAAGSPLSMKEVLKQREIVQQLKTTTEKQAARIALQENQIHTLTAALKQQAEQIQKVSAQLEMIRPTPRVVENR
ncbi:MAG TPA: hypothetical protein VFX07_04255 [Candidatus Udaeobacter sp.]|nr:hypothetical protein [Candidatus Udaeobacter sp.]